MKNLIYLTFLLIVVSCSNKDDSPEEVLNCGVYNGNVLLRTQHEVDEFSKCNYTEITGSLSIYDGNIANPILDLSPLSSLTKIGLDLGVGNLSVVTNLQGLHNITSARGLFVGYIDQLENLDDLDKLQTNRVSINTMPLLENIDALDMDFDTMTSIELRHCPLVTNLNCFSNITKISGALAIENNSSLTDLYGLHNVTSIGTHLGLCCGIIVLKDNQNLQTIDELSSLESIIGGIRIENNYNLLHLDGLSNLTSLIEDIIIRYNFYLIQIDGFKNVTTFDGEIHITENPSLRSYCGLQSILTWGIVDEFVVYGNYNNVSETQILNAPPCD